VTIVSASHAILKTIGCRSRHSATAMPPIRIKLIWKKKEIFFSRHIFTTRTVYMYVC